LESFFKPRTEEDSAFRLAANSLEVKQGQFNESHELSFQRDEKTLI
jgi:hypothetical protein